MTSAALSLRPVVPSDADFLCRVYSSTRVEELAVTGWSDDAKADFLRSQFAAQDAHYRQAYPDARYDIVLCDGEPAGRFYVARLADQIRVVDIALLPMWRGLGLATTLFNELFDEARTAGCPVTIHVEQVNRARRLYQRLGFADVETYGVYILMRWTP